MLVNNYIQIVYVDQPFKCVVKNILLLLLKVFLERQNPRNLIFIRLCILIAYSNFNEEIKLRKSIDELIRDNL